MIRAAAMFALVALGLFIMPASVGAGMLLAYIGHKLYRPGGGDRLAGIVIVLGAAGAAAVFVAFIADCISAAP